jgi:glycosyltransferase involved in cell wall biosynthesis
VTLKVALDATPLEGTRTGVGEFCQEILESFAGRPDLQVGAFAISRRGRSGIAALVPPGVRTLGRPGPGIPARVLHASWARWPFPPAEFYTGPVDVVHGTNFVVPPARKAAMVVTVHDLSPLHFPQWCGPAARAYPDLVKKAVARGAWVHTDSAFVAREVVEALGVPEERVRAVHLGVAPAPAPGAGTTPTVTGGSGTEELPRLLPDWVSSYVLAVGRVEPRKDLPTLVRAFGALAGNHPGLALVIAGPAGRGSEQLGDAIAASPAREHVVRLGWVEDPVRDTLVRQATVFAYPSRYEGFGLSPLHAMASGTPVVASACGALEEVLGDGAWLVPAGDEVALAGALQRLVDDRAAREDLARKGQLRAAEYSWTSCAEGLASLYHELAGSRVS